MRMIYHLTSASYYLVVMHYYTWLFKYCKIHDLLFYFIILLKYLIGMSFINILLLFLYEVNSYESTSRVYVTITSLRKFSSLITLLIGALGIRSIKLECCSKLLTD